MNKQNRYCFWSRSVWLCQEEPPTRITSIAWRTGTGWIFRWLSKFYNHNFSIWEEEERLSSIEAEKGEWLGNIFKQFQENRSPHRSWTFWWNGSTMEEAQWSKSKTRRISSLWSIFQWTKAMCADYWQGKVRGWRTDQTQTVNRLRLQSTELMKSIVEVEMTDIPESRLALLKMCDVGGRLQNKHQHLAISIDLKGNKVHLKGPRSVTSGRSVGNL